MPQAGWNTTFWVRIAAAPPHAIAPAAISFIAGQRGTRMALPDGRKEILYNSCEMAERLLTVPLKEEEVRELKAGDVV